MLNTIPYIPSPMHDHETGTYTTQLFAVGKMFPPPHHIERLAKYERGRKIFEGKHYEIFHRAQSLLADTPYNTQLRTLYIACNIIDVIVTKPADLMFGEPPTFESGKGAESPEQLALNELAEENDLTTLGHEVILSAGYRGDSFLKTYFDYRQDFTEVGYVPDGVEMEAVIEAQDPSTVFPEMARGSRKKFKAINIAYVEWEIDERGHNVPFLNVERHTPGFIKYSRYRLNPNGPEGYSTEYGVGIATYHISEEIPTGRAEDLVATGIPMLLVHHIPYKTTDEEWNGIGTVEKLESLIAAINDRLVQLDYILLKHSDPTAYGPDVDESENMRWGGKYIPVRKDDVAPAYMVWNGQLDAAFKELELLIGMVYQISETPQWLFGTSLSGGNDGGGTSHTDAGAIKARFMPILSKVKRIRAHADKAFRDALYAAQLLENKGNEGVANFTPYEAVYPKIMWNDGIPRDEKEMAEVMQIRTGGRATIDVRSAIKEMEGVNDTQAQEIVNRIHEDEKADGFVNGSVFNSGGGSGSGGSDKAPKGGPGAKAINGAVAPPQVPITSSVGLPAVGQGMGPDTGNGGI